MGDRQTREKLDQVVTKSQCLSVSHGVVRLVRRVGPRELSARGLGIGADLDGFMVAATLLGRA
eukprot:1415966-Lingulodinium_polyedra.AAC.1